MTVTTALTMTFIVMTIIALELPPLVHLVMVVVGVVTVGQGVLVIIVLVVGWLLV